MFFHQYNYFANFFKIKNLMNSKIYVLYDHVGVMIEDTV